MTKARATRAMHISTAGAVRMVCTAGAGRTGWARVVQHGWRPSALRAGETLLRRRMCSASPSSSGSERSRPLGGV